ncbi:hypothetical protein HMPREF9999_01885 [Alloprevotella sp. oral taxon 473 str. F0040]|nr:hypothetical protein HMPREF9999_01885 [Alloprevotella sp. oral taxon 473 str. F0040]
MASRRKLKKSINNICSDLMFVYAVVLQEQSQPNENLQQAGADILALNVEFVKRINHTEPGSVSLFYNKLREEFSEKVRNIYGLLSQA